MFQGIGVPEILIIGIIVLILFGAKRIPEFMQGLGKGIREFRKAAKDIQEEVEKPLENKKIEEKKTE